MKFLSHDGLMYFWTNVKNYIDTKYNELFQSVSNGKSLVASAITGKGITTDATATFATMANNINNIKTGVETGDATASASDILSGKTAYVKGSKVTGSMTNHGSANILTDTILLQDNNVYFNIPNAGYYVAGSDTYTTFSTLASKIGLTANKILQGNTILGVVGTARTESDVVNFPLSIQDTQPTAVRNGHIWVKSSTLASQITSATIVESLNAGAANNSLQFVVGESATSYLWLQNRDKKLTSGGNYISTQIVANNGGSQDWTVSVIGNVMEYKLNRPMVYSKINNVLDVETAYMWNGSTWSLLSEKGKYAILVNSAGAANIFNLSGNTATAKQTLSLTGMSAQEITLPYNRFSRDGKVFVSKEKIYYRTGDIYTLLTSIPSSYQGASGGLGFGMNLVGAIPSGNGQVIFAYYRGTSSSYSKNFTQIKSYKFNGSTFVEEFTSTQIENGQDITTVVYSHMTVNNEGTMCAFAGYNGISHLRVIFRDTSGLTFASLTPNVNFSMLTSRIVFNYAGSEIIVQDGTLTCKRYNVDYANKAIALKDTITIATGSGYTYPRLATSNGYLFYLQGAVLGCYNLNTGAIMTVTPNPVTGTSNTEYVSIAVNLTGDRLLVTQASTSASAKIYSISVSGNTMNLTQVTDLGVMNAYAYGALIPF